MTKHAIVAVLLPALVWGKVFLNTTDPLHRTDDEIRRENIELPMRIDSLIRLDKEEQRRELRAARQEPDTTRIDSSLCLILWPERERLLQQLGLLEAFEEQRRTPSQIVAAGWGGWLAALWLSGWSAEAIAAVIEADSLAASELQPLSPGRLSGWSAGGDPLRPERGGAGIWWGRQLNQPDQTDELAHSQKGLERWREEELRARALLRLRMMVPRLPDGTTRWDERLLLLVNRFDSLATPLLQSSSRRSGETLSLFRTVELSMRHPLEDPPLEYDEELWGGVGKELQPWVEEGLIFPGRERWLLPPSLQKKEKSGELALLKMSTIAAQEGRAQAEYARIAPEKGLLQLRVAQDVLDRASGKKAALELIVDRNRLAGSERWMPFDSTERKGEERALALMVAVELDSVEAQYQGIVETEVLGEAEEQTPVELRQRLAEASESGLFSQLSLALSPDREPLYGQLYSEIGLPLTVGVGPYLLAPAGALVWGRLHFLWVQQILFSASVDGWWGDWAKGVMGEFAMRSESASGFRGSAKVMRSDFDHSGWDTGEMAVLNERASWLELRLLHGHRIPTEIVVRFDNSFFWTALSQEADDLLDYYDLLEQLLIQQGIGDLFVRPSVLVMNAQWRERRGLEMALRWSSPTPETTPWKLHLGFGSYGVEGWYSGVAPLFLRSSIELGRRLELGSRWSIGVEGGAGIDLAMEQLLDGKWRLPPELMHGFDHSDPAIDLVNSQTMGAGLQSPLRRSDDRARGFARIGGALRWGDQRGQLMLGNGLVYRRLPRGIAEEQELQQLLYAELNGKWGVIHWRTGVEQRWRISEKSSGHLSWNGERNGEFRWLMELANAPF